MPGLSNVCIGYSGAEPPRADRIKIVRMVGVRGDVCVEGVGGGVFDAFVRVNVCACGPGGRRHLHVYTHTHIR